MHRLGRTESLRWSRRRRVTTALLALLHLLFMQLAVAAYRCPMGGAETIAAATLAVPPCAEPMTAASKDPKQPNLCQAHCQADEQLNNTLDLPFPPSLAGPGQSSLTPVDDDALLGARPSSQLPWLRQRGAPPLAIQHCCWRI